MILRVHCERYDKLNHEIRKGKKNKKQKTSKKINKRVNE